MVSLGALREKSIKLLSENNIEEARVDTDFLLFFLTGAEKKDIILGNKEIDDNTERIFYDALKRRILGEPVQYIVGFCEFMSHRFKVSPSTLIPRADTEILAEECISLINEKKLKTVLDIGTGSGCIALSILKYCPHTYAKLIDVSQNALLVAGENAEMLGVSERAELFEKDILKDGLDEFDIFDIVVSNPPYIETDEVKKLDEKVKNFEPESALDGGTDGLEFYRRITTLAAKKAKYLAFEIGYNQKETVREIMEEYFCDIKLLYDYGGNPRVLVGKNIQI